VVFLLIAIGFTGEKPPLPSPSGFLASSYCGSSARLWSAWRSARGD